MPSPMNMHANRLGAAAAADWLRRVRLQEERDPPEEHLCRSDAAESAIAVVTVDSLGPVSLSALVVTLLPLWRWRADGDVPRGRRYRRKSVVFTKAEVDQIFAFVGESI